MTEARMLHKNLKEMYRECNSVSYERFCSLFVRSVQEAAEDAIIGTEEFKYSPDNESLPESLYGKKYSM